ncbi:hypothetical protein TRFO_29456 [Tritrichomonas foetus]|uniref:Right handed beta helix domain-containing protein n=1 Tax=Tritrichomonas foetus TaxID=1144522 RepID=A0A1J4K0F0_9EUKA|nr:hypothetical protein TRFO_29456 [Tritrichomonas foetus]|eukprot:OHT03214.1 hypothetical protein TRFO_29456 [Tritrichomonas foetus]
MLFFFLGFFNALNCDISQGNVFISTDTNNKVVVECNSRTNQRIDFSETIFLTGKSAKYTVKCSTHNNEKIKMIFKDFSVHSQNDIPLQVVNNTAVNLIFSSADVEITSTSKDSIFIEENSISYFECENGHAPHIKSPTSLIGGNGTLYFNNFFLTASDIMGNGIIGKTINIDSSNIEISSTNTSIGGNFVTGITIHNSNIKCESSNSASIGKTQENDELNIFISNSTIISHSKDDGPAIGQSSENGTVKILNSNINASSTGFFATIGGCGIVNIDNSTVFSQSIRGTPIGGPGLEARYIPVYINITNSKVDAHTDHKQTCRSAAIGGGKSDRAYIYIFQSTVNATANFYGAAIGNGVLTYDGNATIIKSKVYAKNYGYEAAGIGGGSLGHFNTIFIDESNVEAYAGMDSAGIGASTAQKIKQILIYNSTIKAVSWKSGAAIGGAKASPTIQRIIIENCKVEAIASGIDLTIIPEAAAIGGGNQPASSDIMKFADELLIKNSSVKAFGGGYAAAIGGGHHEGIGNITFLDSSVEAINTIEHFVNLSFSNNPGSAIGTGGSVPFPYDKRYSNMEGSINVINCIVKAVGGSLQNHKSSLAMWRAASGIGLGGCNTHSHDNSGLKITFINSTVEVEGGNASIPDVYPGAAIGGMTKDLNVAFHSLVIDNSTVNARSGESLVPNYKHAALGFPSPDSGYGNITLKNKAKLVILTPYDKKSIGVSINKLILEDGVEMFIHSLTSDVSTLNIQQKLYNNVSCIVIKHLSSYEYPIHEIHIKSNKQGIWEKNFNISSDDAILFTVPNQNVYNIYGIVEKDGIKQEILLFSEVKISSEDIDNYVEFDLIQPFTTSELPDYWSSTESDSSDSPLTPIPTSSNKQKIPILVIIFVPIAGLLVSFALVVYCIFIKKSSNKQKLEDPARDEAHEREIELIDHEA